MSLSKAKTPLILFTGTDPEDTEFSEILLKNVTIINILVARDIDYKIVRQYGPADSNGIRRYTFAFVIPLEGNMALAKGITEELDISCFIEIDCFRNLWGHSVDGMRIGLSRNLVNVNRNTIPDGQGYFYSASDNQFYTSA